MVIDELKIIFHNYRKWDADIEHKLNNIGIRVVYQGKHIKCYIGKKGIVTIATTSSDINAGKQIVRCFRRELKKEDI